MTEFVPAEKVGLDQLRATLIRLEETIIFGLIERAQYKRNETVYEADKTAPVFGISDYGGSFFDFFLQETEALHAKVRRYTDPTEHPFSKELPEPIPRPGLKPGAPPANRALNLNGALREIYLSRIVPSLSADGDDGEYGSTVTADVALVQALSRRIHIGKAVAEAKWAADGGQEKYTSLAKSGDWRGILSALTVAAVEERLLHRVRLKAAAYGSDPTVTNQSQGQNQGQNQGSNDTNKGDHQEAKGNGGGPKSSMYKIDPELVVGIYRDHIIPLTKEVEVRYLFLRAGVDISASGYNGAYGEN